MNLTRLYGLHFLSDGLQGALLVLLPFIAGELGLTEGQVGWVAAGCFLMGSLLSAPASLAVRGRSGRRLLPAAVVLSGVCAAVAALTGGFASLFAVYLAAGIGFGVFHPIAFGLIARDSAPASTSRGMGLFTAAGDFGRTAVSAAVMGLLPLFAWRPLLVTVGVPVAIGALVLALLERPARRAAQQEGRAAVAVRGRVPGDRGFWLLCVIGFCDGLANSSLYVFLPFLLLAKGCGPSQLALLMPLFFGACLSGRVVLGWVGDRWGRVAGLAVCQAALAVVIAGLCAGTGMVGTSLWLVLLGICTRGSLPLVQALTAERLPREKIESGFAVNQVVLGMAATLSPLLLGHVARAAGTTAAFAGAAVLCAVNVGLILLLRALLAPRAVRLDPV